MNRSIQAQLRRRQPPPELEVERQLTVRLSDELYARLRIEAAHRRGTMRAIVEAALEKELQSRG